jgi:hypothetical protein
LNQWPPKIGNGGPKNTGQLAKSIVIFNFGSNIKDSLGDNPKFLFQWPGAW